MRMGWIYSLVKFSALSKISPELFAASDMFETFDVSVMIKEHYELLDKQRNKAASFFGLGKSTHC